MLKDKRKQEERQRKSAWLEGELYQFLKPLLRQLKERSDQRLVSTFLGLVMVVLIHRHRNHGLLLGELVSHF
jgi:hypothetical protein